MTVAIRTPAPVRGQPQPPIYPLIVGNNGAYLAVRSSPAQGACGVSSYPCKHPGVDVNAPQGTVVRAPESGQIVAVANGASPPFTGYGPWLVVIYGDTSKRFHLLAHLDPATASMGTVGARVVAGDPVGTVSSARHTHWELRQKLTPGAGGTNFTNNTDPVAWLAGAGSSLGTLLVLGVLGVAAYLAVR